MDLLQIRNFARERLAHRIRHTRAWRRLFKPHSHHIEPSHTRRKRTWGEHIGRTRRAKVGSVNHLLHSIFNQIDVYFKNPYRYQTTLTHTAYIALLNYASPAKTSHSNHFCLWNADISGRHIKLVKSKYSARETRNTFKEIAL